MSEGELAQESNKMDNKYQRSFGLECKNSAKYKGSLDVGMGVLHFSMLGEKRESLPPNLPQY